MKIVTVVGARPQFIKVAAVSRVLGRSTQVSEVMVHTGQHYDENMSDVFFEELEIPRPAYQLNVGSSTHGAQTGRMLEQIEQVLLAERPDWVMVYGDTNSTLAGALAAVKLHVPVAHVEAGLRSFNRAMPEEINRVLTDHASDLLFAPTQVASEHLQREGVPASKVRLVGDVMYDAAIHFGGRADRKSSVLEQYGLHSQQYILATVHRAENTDAPDRLRAIIEGLVAVAQYIPVVLPLHPRTRSTVARLGLELLLTGIKVIPPVGYLDMVKLEKNARLIATDSGGVQKEAFFYRVPCVTLRDETEWVELVNLGWNTLVSPTSTRAVFEGIMEGIQPTNRLSGEPYGNGQAGEKILDSLMSDRAGER